MRAVVPIPGAPKCWRFRALSRHCIALAAMLCALSPFVPHVHAADISGIPRGVYNLPVPGKAVASGILINPLVAGVSLRWTWPAVEGSEGVYNWSYFDQQIARVGGAGKKVLLRITAGGKNSPSWVFQAGVQTFTFVDSNPYSPTYQQTVTIPVFWDSIFMAKKKSFIAAMGQHFADNPHVALVAVMCANATTDDWHVPSTKTDVANWKAIGYTSDKLINACKKTVDATMTAFPNRVVALAVGRSQNNLDPNPDYVANAVVNYAVQKYPGRFIVQKNSLSADTPDPEILTALGAWQIIYNNRPSVAGQMLWFVTNESTCRMNGKVKPCDPATVLLDAVATGANYGMLYQEIYQQDILNPALADVIDYADSVMAP
jgi:Beta-galactosidase